MEGFVKNPGMPEDYLGVVRDVHFARGDVLTALEGGSCCLVSSDGCNVTIPDAKIRRHVVERGRAYQSC